MRLLKNYALALALALFCLEAVSEEHHHRLPQGFWGDYNRMNNVDEIYLTCRDDDIIILRGRLTRYFGDEDYEFTDENGGTIEVELDDKYDWSHVSKDELIDIVGKVDRDDFRVKLEVREAKAATLSQ